MRTPYHELQNFIETYQHTSTAYGLAKLIYSLAEPSPGGYGLGHCVAEFDSGYREFAREIVNHFLTQGLDTELAETIAIVRRSYPDLAAEVRAMGCTSERFRAAQIDRLLGEQAAA